MKKIENLKPQHRFIIGVDSDGCAFDTMEMKHKKVFIPLAVELWNLGPIEKEFCDTAEFVNLYSCFRGMNRFPALLKTFQLMEKRKDMEGRTDLIPDYTQLMTFCEEIRTYSNDSLKKYMEYRKDPFLEKLLMWSEEGDRRMEIGTKGNRPFPYVEKSLQMAAESCDLVIISSAAASALEYEWGQCGLAGYMAAAAGQEAGDKKHQLKTAKEKGYAGVNCLMIGDSLGDLLAAKENGFLFYPVMPADEISSWRYFYETVYSRFLNGSYQGGLEDGLMKEFRKRQPETTPWEMIDGGKTCNEI